MAATPASADRDEQPAATRADASLPDPDGVGRCPRQATSPVVRRGIDVDRWPTWWHADGSLTKRIRQQVGGELVPAVLTMTPASGRQR